MLTIYAVKRINDCISLIVGEANEQNEPVEMYIQEN